MPKMDYFIDIERFIKWTNNNKKKFGSVETHDFGENTLKKWRRYEVLPDRGSLETVNKILDKGEKSFERINIADMLICVNNAKDHNRGKNVELTSITSTGKKVMTLFLLGRILDGKNENGFLIASKEKDRGVYEYLDRISQGNQSSKRYYYLPGRTVSYKQLCDLSKDYKNGVTTQGIYIGLLFLQEIGLIECVGKDLYKLSFDGCKEFLEKNK